MTTTETHRRAILNGPVEVDLGGEIGVRPVRFDDESLMRVELELDDILDRLNARLDRAGDEPYESVWEALEELTVRYPIVTIRILLLAALPGLESVPMQTLNDPKIADALTEAIALAFGQDPAELPQEDGESLDPPDGAAGAAASTGGPSTPSGPAPSR